MATPKGFRSVRFAAEAGDAVHVFSGRGNIILQLRREVRTEHDPTATSFKAAVTLTPVQALAIAGELLTAASRALTPASEP